MRVRVCAHVLQVLAGDGWYAGADRHIHPYTTDGDIVRHERQVGTALSRTSVVDSLVYRLFSVVAVRNRGSHVSSAEQFRVSSVAAKSNEEATSGTSRFAPKRGYKLVDSTERNEDGPSAGVADAGSTDDFTQMQVGEDGAHLSTHTTTNTSACRPYCRTLAVQSYQVRAVSTSASHGSLIEFSRLYGSVFVDERHGKYSRKFSRHNPALSCSAIIGHYTTGVQMKSPVANQRRWLRSANYSAYKMLRSSLICTEFRSCCLIA